MSSKEQKQRRWCGIVFCGIIPVILFLLAIKTDCLAFAVNDDTGMRSMAIGAYSGEEEAHLTYPSYIWGCIISWLYKIFPALDWYGILLWCLPIIGLCLVMNQLQGNMQGLKHRIVFSLLTLMTILLVLGADLMRLQWTVSAGLCGISGSLVYYWGDGKQSANLQALFLLWCGLLIRKHSFYITMVLLGLLFVYKEADVLWNHEKRCICQNQLKPFLKRNLWLAGFALLFVVTALTTDKAYSSEEWISYNTYSHNRSLLYDYQKVPGWDNAKNFYEANGYSQETVSMLKAYLIGFLDDIDSEDFAAIREYAKEQRGKPTEQIKNTLISLAGLRNSTYAEIICVLVVGTVLLLGYKFCQRVWKDVCLLITSSFLCFAMIFWLEINGKLPDRVLIIILLVQMSTVLVVLYSTIVQNGNGFRPTTQRQKLAWLMLAFCVATVLMIQQKKQYEGIITLRNSNAEARMLDEYYNGHPENYYIIADNGGISSTRNFAFVNEYPTPGNTIDTMGWGIRNPLWYSKLALAGATSLTEAAILDNVYVCVYSKERIDLLVEYLQSVGNNVQAERVDVFEFSAEEAPMLIYKIQEV